MALHHECEGVEIAADGLEQLLLDSLHSGGHGSPVLGGSADDGKCLDEHSHDVLHQCVVASVVDGGDEYLFLSCDAVQHLQECRHEEVVLCESVFVAVGLYLMFGEGEIGGVAAGLVVVGGDGLRIDGGRRVGEELVEVGFGLGKAFGCGDVFFLEGAVECRVLLGCGLCAVERLYELAEEEAVGDTVEDEVVEVLVQEYGGGRLVYLEPVERVAEDVVGSYSLLEEGGVGLVVECGDGDFSRCVVAPLLHCIAVFHDQSCFQIRMCVDDGCYGVVQLPGAGVGELECLGDVVLQGVRVL